MESLDFDRLKQDYKEALSYLKRGRSAADKQAPAFVFDRVRLIDELRDLVARGFPVNEKNLARNGAYRTCAEYVAAGLAHVFRDPKRFQKINDQLVKLKTSAHDVYCYDNARQILSNALDPKTRATAVRQYAFVKKALERHGFHELKDFFEYLVGMPVENRVEG